MSAPHLTRDWQVVALFCQLPSLPTEHISACLQMMDKEERIALIVADKDGKTAITSFTMDLKGYKKLLKLQAEQPAGHTVKMVRMPPKPIAEAWLTKQLLESRSARKRAA